MNSRDTIHFALRSITCECIAITCSGWLVRPCSMIVRFVLSSMLYVESMTSKQPQFYRLNERTTPEIISNRIACTLIIIASAIYSHSFEPPASTQHTNTCNQSHILWCQDASKIVDSKEESFFFCSFAVCRMHSCVFYWSTKRLINRKSSGLKFHSIVYL